MYPKAENLMRRWISLLRSGPQDELAEAISHLAVLHIYCDGGDSSAEMGLR
jgi:hypothetical protein